MTEHQIVWVFSVSRDAWYPMRRSYLDNNKIRDIDIRSIPPKGAMTFNDDAEYLNELRNGK